MLQDVSCDEIDEPLHIILVVKTEFWGISQQSNLLSEDHHAEAVKGAKRSLGGHLGVHESSQALPHLGCCLIRKRKPQDGFGRNSKPPDKIGHPHGEDAGLSTPSPSQNQHTPLHCLNSPPLRLVEQRELLVICHGFDLNCADAERL